LDFKTTIESYYALTKFNVPYRITKVGKGKKAIAGKNKNNEKFNVFAERADKLRGMNDLVTRALSLYASSLMYINTKEVSKDIDTNSVYLVAGKGFILASEILEDILKEIESEEKSRSFHISASVSDTIISRYNAGDRTKSLAEVIDSTELKSSYTF
jgi:hypothetical protein